MEATNQNKILLNNVHECLSLPCHDGKLSIVRGNYKYYHYGCDEFNDRGWGCGYRTLQSLCSWVCSVKGNKELNVPSIPEIQKTLVALEDKPKRFLGSREWIGCYEVCIVIDHLYDTPCKIIHISSSDDIRNHSETIFKHFEDLGSPIVMGGDQDCSSKGIMGILVADTETYLLIVDPHFWGKAASAKQIQNLGYVKWEPVTNLLESSFYNVCLPQLKFT